MVGKRVVGKRGASHYNDDNDDDDDYNDDDDDDDDYNDDDDDSPTVPEIEVTGGAAGEPETWFLIFIFQIQIFLIAKGSREKKRIHLTSLTNGLTPDL